MSIEHFYDKPRVPIVPVPRALPPARQVIPREIRPRSRRRTTAEWEAIIASFGDREFLTDEFAAKAEVARVYASQFLNISGPDFDVYVVGHRHTGHRPATVFQRKRKN